MDNKTNIENEQGVKNEPIVRPKSQRVLAWIVIVLLLSMYVITLVSALSGAGTTSSLFMMSLGSTVVLPGLLWLYIRFWKFSSKRDRETFREDVTGVKTGAGMKAENDGSHDEPDDQA
ncbi:MAG TPA: hypothetical protein DCP06_04310 [Lachnospiraceae bacterium]|nr:hypothetical protein [Lachnospiraceae bacterium]